MQTGVVEVAVADAFEDVDEVEQMTVTDYTPGKFKIKDGKVEEYTKETKRTVPFVKGTKKVLKAGHILNEDTGKVYRKMTRDEAEAKAETNFVFDWSKQPKFIRDAWGK